jgi:N-acetyl-anhydromuramyl-L-alanine amidase AmpD
MWKVIIVVCTLGNPCVVMQEDPIRFYDNKSECMANASTKHSRILESFSVYGYEIEKSDFTCEKVDNII